MTRPTALFPIALALGATILVPEAGAREPTPIKACQTISKPGSYELANNLQATGGECLRITASFVTIDLAGFLIQGGAFGTGISADSGLQGIAVRNGSIQGFVNGVILPNGSSGPQRFSSGSIVEGLRITGFKEGVGIFAIGIIRNNFVGISGNGSGINAAGTVTGNYVSDNVTGIFADAGSTVIGNTTTNNFEGISVACPSNVTDYTSTGNRQNLVLEGDGCNNTNNVAP